MELLSIYLQHSSVYPAGRSAAWTHIAFCKQQHADHSEEAQVERQQQDDTAQRDTHTHGYS